MTHPNDNSYHLGVWEVLLENILRETASQLNINQAVYGLIYNHMRRIFLLIQKSVRLF